MKKICMALLVAVVSFNALASGDDDANDTCWPDIMTRANDALASRGYSTDTLIRNGNPRFVKSKKGIAVQFDARINATGPRGGKITEHGNHVVTVFLPTSDGTNECSFTGAAVVE